jgi:tripartite-type tricarboxylate transporter receptor subunit TctC
MNMLKRSIISFVLCLTITGTSLAQSTYKYIIPTAPGTVSDLISRAIVDEYHKISKNKLDVENIPGGDFIIGINRFKSCKEPCLIATGTAVQITNFLTKTDLPYKIEDFEHVGWIGWFPNVIYVNANSDIKTLYDLRKKLENKQDITIAISDTVNQLNVAALHKKYSNKNTLRIINYKTSPQGLQDVINGSVDVAMVAPGTAILGASDAGLIRIIGSTHSSEINLGGQNIPSSQPVLETETFQSSQTLSITPGAKGEKYERLKAELLEAIRSKSVAEKLEKAYIIVDGSDGQRATQQLNRERQRANQFKSLLTLE